MITATGSVCKMGRAASPRSARSTRNSAARMASSESSTLCSSSTIRIVGCSRVPSSGSGCADGDAVSVAQDLVEQLPVLDPFQLRCAELPVAHQVADLAERPFGSDYMRVEEPCHALNARG